MRAPVRHTAVDHAEARRLRSIELSPAGGTMSASPAVASSRHGPCSEFPCAPSGALAMSSPDVERIVADRQGRFLCWMVWLLGAFVAATFAAGLWVALR